MPESIYSQSYYPYYCNGYTTLYSPGCIVKLYNEAMKHNITFLQQFSVDDALYSGVFREKVCDAQHVQVSSVYIGRSTTTNNTIDRR
jgi:hypothetical protein